MLNRNKRYEREEKELEEIKEKTETTAQIKLFKDEVFSLKADLALAQAEKEDSDKHADMLSRLYEINIIDQDGNLINKNSFLW